MTTSDLDLMDLLGDLPATIPAVMATAQLAAHFGVTDVTIRDLASDGVLTRVGRGRFDVAESTRGYLKRLRELKGAAGRPSMANADQKAEQLRFTMAKADAQEMKNRQLAGDVLDRAGVLREWQGVLRDVRAALLAVPSRYGATSPHLSKTDIARLEGEIKAALETLADA